MRFGHSPQNTDNVLKREESSTEKAPLNSSFYSPHQQPLLPTAYKHHKFAMSFKTILVTVLAAIAVGSVQAFSGDGMHTSCHSDIINSYHCNYRDVLHTRWEHGCLWTPDQEYRARCSTESYAVPEWQELRPQD